jgi:hypothetical protein
MSSAACTHVEQAWRESTASNAASLGRPDSTPVRRCLSTGILRPRRHLRGSIYGIREPSRKSSVSTIRRSTNVLIAPARSLPVRLNSRGFRLRLRRWSRGGDIERRPDRRLASQFGVRGGLAGTNHKCLLESLPNIGNKLLIV